MSFVQPQHWMLSSSSLYLRDSLQRCTGWLNLAEQQTLRHSQWSAGHICLHLNWLEEVMQPSASAALGSLLHNSEQSVQVQRGKTAEARVKLFSSYSSYSRIIIRCYTPIACNGPVLKILSFHYSNWSDKISIAYTLSLTDDKEMMKF